LVKGDRPGDRVEALDPQAHVIDGGYAGDARNARMHNETTVPEQVRRPAGVRGVETSILRCHDR